MFTARISLVSFIYICYLILLIAVRNVPSVADARGGVKGGGRNKLPVYCYSPSHPIPNPTDCNHAVRLMATTPVIFGPVAFFVHGDCEVSLMRLWHQPTPPGQPQQLHPTPLQQ